MSAPILAIIPTIDDTSPHVEFQFTRSSGPGGQNVNKVNTRATLLFDFANCDALTRTQKATLRRTLATRLSSDGRLRVVSQRARTQIGNRQHALERLNELLSKTLEVKKPRKATRPSQGSKLRRLDEKKKRGDKKRLRGPVRPPE